MPKSLLLIASAALLVALIVVLNFGTIPNTKEDTLTAAASNALASGATSATYLSVIDYGAKGDGAADDTPAIQKAINATPTGGKLVFPTGVYKTTAPLKLHSNMTIAGASQLNSPTSFPDNNECAIIKGAFSGPVLNYDYDYDLSANGDKGNIGIYDLCIDGNNQATDGIYFQKHRGLRLQRVNVKDVTQHGIYLSDPVNGSSYTSDMEDVYINMGNSTVSAGVRIDTPWAKISRLVTDGAAYGVILAGTKAVITDSHIEGARIAAIDIRSGSNRVIGNILVMTNPGNAQQIGINQTNVTANTENIVSDNIITGVTATQSVGIYIAGAAAGVGTFMGNHINGFNIGVDNRGQYNTFIGNDIAATTKGYSFASNYNSIIGGTVSAGTYAVDVVGGTGNKAHDIYTTAQYQGITPEEAATNSTPSTPVSGSCTVSPNPVAVGVPLTWTAVASGGSGAPYMYDWGSWTTSNTYTQSVSVAGTYPGAVKIKDSAGNVSSTISCGSVVVR